MRNQRSFSLEFKRQVVEELMSGESCLRCDFSSVISLFTVGSALRGIGLWGLVLIGFSEHALENLNIPSLPLPSCKLGQLPLGHLL